MKSDEIRNLFSKFESAASDLEDVEYWSARELQELLGYSKWENFEKVIQKAKEACNNAGEEMGYHFPDIRKTIPMPKGAEKEIDDILLTRNAVSSAALNIPSPSDCQKNLRMPFSYSGRSKWRLTNIEIKRG